MRLRRSVLFAGAGLADDVEMPAAFLGVEHDRAARDDGRRCKAPDVAMSWAEGSRRAVRTAVGKWCWQRPVSRRVRRGYMASLSLCVDDLTAEPPAHCRLVSDHDLCEIVACSILSAQTAAWRGEGGDSARAGGQSIFFGSVLLFGRGRSSVPALRHRVHGAQRRSRTAVWPPVGFILDRSEHRAKLVAAAGSAFADSRMLRTARGIVVHMDWDDARLNRAQRGRARPRYARRARMCDKITK